MVVMLKQCCCGCTLKTGALIIAVMFAILAALQVVIYSVAAVEVSEKYEYMRAHRHIDEEDGLTTTEMAAVEEEGHPPPANGTHPDHHHDQRDEDPITRLIYKWCMILLSITETLSFFLNILLMFAANKESAPHVLVCLLGFLGTSCSRLLLQLIVVGTVFYLDAIVAGFILLTLLTLIAMGAAYSLLVVHSYYRLLVGTSIARRISCQDE